MIIVKVYTTDTPWYVLSEDLKNSVQKYYENQPEISDDILSKFSKLIAGSSARILNREPLKIGIYPHDIAAIFSKINVPIKFIDEKNKELNIYMGNSGVLFS